MRLRTLAVTALATPLAALAALTPPPATAAPAPHSARAPHSAPAFHSAPAAPYAPSEDWSYKCVGPIPPIGTYLCDDEHLGPRYRPEEWPVAALVKAYTPFGTLNNVQFLRQHSYYQGGKFRWKYPPYDGFLTATHNDEEYPLRKAKTLTVGTLVDRFGGATGRFLSPAGTSFEERALPPDALNTPSGGPLYNYHCYEVIQEFKVDAGPAAPAFEQPGDAIQYHLAYSPSDPNRLAKTTVNDLKGRYLEEKPVADCAPE